MDPDRCILGGDCAAEYPSGQACRGRKSKRHAVRETRHGGEYRQGRHIPFQPRHHRRHRHKGPERQGLAQGSANVGGLVADRLDERSDFHFIGADIRYEGRPLQEDGNSKDQFPVHHRLPVIKRKEGTKQDKPENQFADNKAQPDSIQ